MLWKCCIQYGSKFGKLSSGPKTGKGFILIPKKGNASEGSNYRTIAIISHTSKVMLKFLQARLQQYMKHELPDALAGFRKDRGTREQITNIYWHIKKAREFQKNICFCLLTMQKSLTLWITTNWKILKEMGITWPASWEIYMQVKKQQLKPYMEQQTNSKSEKEYVKAVYCHPAYLTYMQSTSWEMLDCMKHKLESRLPREISITSDMQMTPPLWQKVKKN